jgi:myosin heavy subunit
MEQMKASGRSAGEMVAYLMTALNTKYTGTLDEARSSLDGIRKAADDAAGDASKAISENYMGMMKVFSRIREGWWSVVEFFARNPLSLNMTDNAAGASRALADKFLGDKKRGPGEGPTSIQDMIAKGNAVASAAPETDEARKVRLDGEKKVADEAAKIHADLLKRKEAAALAYEEAQRDRAQKLEDRQRKRLDAQMWANTMTPGSNAQIENEAKVLELNKEILEIKKDIAAENERKSESLMMRDRNLREMSMTPEQRRNESRKRQDDLEAQLAAEKDPGKRLDIGAKLMDESEKQASLSKGAGMKSMSIGDLFTKSWGQQRGKQDPAHETSETMKRVERILINIEKKRGGLL